MYRLLYAHPFKAVVCILSTINKLFFVLQNLSIITQNNIAIDKTHRLLDLNSEN